MPPEMEEKLWMGLMRKPEVNLSTEFLLREMIRFNDAVRKLSTQYDVELIDLEKEVPKDLDHFYDDVHFTPEGSKRVAEVITTYLLQHREKITPQSVVA